MRCEDKNRYQNETEALVAASRALRKPKNTRTLRVYECPRCKGWHLTHKLKRDLGTVRGAG